MLLKLGSLSPNNWVEWLMVTSERVFWPGSFRWDSWARAWRSTATWRGWVRCDLGASRPGLGRTDEAAPATGHRLTDDGLETKAEQDPWEWCVSEEPTSFIWHLQLQEWSNWNLWSLTMAMLKKKLLCSCRTWLNASSAVFRHSSALLSSSRGAFRQIRDVKGIVALMTRHQFSKPSKSLKLGIWGLLWWLGWDETLKTSIYLMTKTAADSSSASGWAGRQD